MDAGSLAITILTVMLVLVTAWYAHQTHRMADTASDNLRVVRKATKSAAAPAAAAERSAQILGQQLAVHAMPVVTWTGLGIKSNAAGNAEVDVSLVNVGTGPALNLNLSVVELDEDGGLTSNRAPSPPVPLNVPMSVGESPLARSFVLGPTATWQLDTNNYALVAVYQDAMGREWRSISPREQFGRPMRVERLDENGIQYKRYL